ncbi:MAG: hypothetical protein OQL09_04075, partial [Gammaproteobacteria bacterium]|nr:hypothetical protein [Gammaproteobacteria bacterium]
AMGFTLPGLSAAVLLESIILVILAIPVANIFAYLLAQLIHEVAPIYLILSNEPGPVMRTIVASLFFALLGALLSFKVIARLDPVIAFRSSA